ncbi:hypothetical protein RI543_002231 [Arxiozyma heterogenica]|uniref:Uncharacterized protein n=1 Tax=Arxiozyma heterogenica TaxID=278026 RepID=A0AAN7WRE4_9SACH|nr:hypothetical protein RI543_002231 [Kazachstania heterogenica]
MPRQNRRGKLPKGPKAKMMSLSMDRHSASTSNSSMPSSRRSTSPNKKKLSSNGTNSKNNNRSAVNNDTNSENGSSNNENNTTKPSDFTVTNLNSPTSILSSILSILNLSFDKDTGMLKGANVKTLPDNKQTLINLKDRLTALNDLLTQITKEDNDTMEAIRQVQIRNIALNKITGKGENNKRDSNLQNKIEQQKKLELLKNITDDMMTSTLQENGENKKSPTVQQSLDIENKSVKDEISEQKENLPNKQNSPLDSSKSVEVNTDSSTPNDNVKESILISQGQNNRLSQRVSPIDNVSNKVENDNKRDLPDEFADISHGSTQLDGPDTKKIKLKDYNANSKATSSFSSSSTVTTIATTIRSELLTLPSSNNNKDIQTPSTTDVTSNDNISLENEKHSSVDVGTLESSVSTPYSIERDTRLKNPKSEFVVSQTLPKAAKDLGLYTEEGLESTGEEYLKKKYNVASYPTNDLKEYLPGVIPDKDFSCPKPSNQIQYNTFLAFVDNFLRPLNDEDIKFLESKYVIPSNIQIDKNYDPNVTPFVIPKLGPLYTKVWLKEDSKTAGNLLTAPSEDLTSILPKKSASSLNDSMLESEEISCGPLLSRLLSAILRDERDSEIRGEENNESTVKTEFADDINTPTQSQDGEDLSSSMQTSPAISIKDELHSNLLSKNNQYSPIVMKEIPLGGGTTNTLPNTSDWNINSINLDYPTFEERLKRELKYVGIYMNLPKDENSPNNEDPDWITGREDDEISAELRELQSTLKSVTRRNQRRKEILKPLLERALAWQEYLSILDDLDKQIDQAYVKRIRAPKKKKRHHSSASTSGGNGHLHGGDGGNGGSGNYTSNISASQLAQQKAANSSLKALLDKRQRWISKIGPIFDKPEIMKRIPKESVFKDLDQEDDYEDGEGDVFEQNNDNKEGELTET